MIPLVFADQGSEHVISKIGGSQEVRQHLFDLGFVIGESVMIVSQLGGSLIIKGKEARVAISREMAEKIYV